MIKEACKSSLSGKIWEGVKEGISFDNKEDSMNCYTGHIEIACIKSSREELLPKVQRLVMKVANELGGYAFMPPASTYHKFMTGLQGGKMSSSIPESYIALTEAPEEGAKKVMRAKTGGRVTWRSRRSSAVNLMYAQCTNSCSTI